MQYRKRMLRKKGTALLLSALLLASALPLAAYAEEVSAKTTEYVNFRSGPGTNYSSQGIIASGTTITVTDTSNSEWYAVRLSNGSTGYIYAEYISMSTGGSTSNGEERSAKTTEYVNFRSGPGTNYNSKGVIALGTTVTVTDTSNAQWYAVRLSNGSTGYIFAEYISFTGSNTPSATAAPTQAPSNGSEQSAKTTEYVNFRSGPGTNYSSKGVIALGTTVTVTDTSNSEWYAVRLSNGSTGYIFAQYLKLNSSSSATATPAPSGSEQSAKTTEYVNFRSGPGTNYSSKGVIAFRHNRHGHRHEQFRVVRRAPLERLYGLHICAIFEVEQFFLRNGNARTDTGTERFRAKRENDGIRKLPFRPRHELQL